MRSTHIDRWWNKTSELWPYHPPMWQPSSGGLVHFFKWKAIEHSVCWEPQMRCRWPWLVNGRTSISWAGEGQSKSMFWPKVGFVLSLYSSHIHNSKQLWPVLCLLLAPHHYEIKLRPSLLYRLSVFNGLELYLQTVKLSVGRKTNTITKIFRGIKLCLISNKLYSTNK